MRSSWRRHYRGGNGAEFRRRRSGRLCLVRLRGSACPRDPCSIARRAPRPRPVAQPPPRPLQRLMHRSDLPFVQPQSPVLTDRRLRPAPHASQQRRRPQPLQRLLRRPRQPLRRGRPFRAPRRPPHQPAQLHPVRVLRDRARSHRADRCPASLAPLPSCHQPQRRRAPRASLPQQHSMPRARRHVVQPPRHQDHRPLPPARRAHCRPLPRVPVPPDVRPQRPRQVVHPHRQRPPQARSTPYHGANRCSVRLTSVARPRPVSAASTSKSRTRRTTSGRSGCRANSPPSHRRSR